MKKLITFMMALFILLSLSACNENKENVIKLGTSNYTLTLPEGYKKAEDDFDEDQIAYYYKDDESIDFDLYQWDKAGEYELVSEAEYFAAEYGTTAESIEINGIPCMKYVSLEDYEGYTYTIVNYMFEDEETILEVCFWTVDTSEEYAVVDEIINTLKKN